MTHDNLTSNFDRQRLVENLRRSIKLCDFMEIYRHGKPILVVAPDRDLATIASYLVDGVSGGSIIPLHAAGDVLGIYEAWDNEYATFAAEPGDEVRYLFAAPAFIVQRTGKSLE